MYPVPAIAYRVTWGDDYLNNMIYWDDMRFGDDNPIMVALVDMSFDRAMDLDQPFGVYYQL